MRKACPARRATASLTTTTKAAASAATAVVASVTDPLSTLARAAKAGVRLRVKASFPCPASTTISPAIAPGAAIALAWLATAQASCRVRPILNRTAKAAAATCMSGSRSDHGVNAGRS